MLVVSLLILCAAEAGAQVTRVYVNEGFAGGGGSNTACSFNTGAHGTTAGNPLKSDASSVLDGLAQAIQCANAYTGSNNFEIVVLCSSPSPSYCTYVNTAAGNDGRFTLSGSAPTSRRFSVRGEPAGLVRIEVRFHFDTVDDLYNDYAGWYVDDVEVK